MVQISKTKTHIFVGDPHAHYQHNNIRAEWLGHLICDIRPDVVINAGDTWDMPSLSDYDRGKASIGRTYRADINAGIDFNSRLWSTVRRAKKKLPRRVFLIGNHEYRIEKAINQTPTLEGTIGYRDLELDRYYDEVVYYTGNTPGVTTIDGIQYGHFLVSGVAGRPVSGEHGAYSLLCKQHVSTTVGHNHTLDYCLRTRGDGRKIAGLVAGCFFDYQSSWAGESQRYYWSGVVIKRSVEDGYYDPEFVSLDRLRRTYGKRG